MPKPNYVYGTKVRIDPRYKALLHRISVFTGQTMEAEFRGAVRNRAKTLDVVWDGDVSQSLRDICHKTGRTIMAEAHLILDQWAVAYGLPPVRPLSNTLRSGEYYA